MKRRKILAWLLTMTLVLTLLPVPVFAGLFDSDKEWTPLTNFSTSLLNNGATKLESATVIFCKNLNTCPKVVNGNIETDNDMVTHNLYVDSDNSIFYSSSENTGKIYSTSNLDYFVVIARDNKGGIYIYGNAYNAVTYYNDTKTFEVKPAKYSGSPSWCAAKKYVTVTADNASFGTVSGSGFYDYNASATLTATNKSGYFFTGWSDDNTAPAERTIKVGGDVTYTANFAQIQAKDNNNKFYASVADALNASNINSINATSKINLTAVKNGTLKANVKLTTDKGSFTAKDGAATIDMDSTGAVTLTSGKLEVTGAETKGTTVKTKFTVAENGKEVEVTVPNGVTATIDLVATPQAVKSLASGQSVTISGITYTAVNNSVFPLADSKLTNNGEKATVPAGTSANVKLGNDTTDDPAYTAPVVNVTNANTGNTTVKKTDNGGTVTVANSGDSFTVSEKTYTAGSDGAEFAVDEKGNVAITSGSAKIGDGVSITGKSGQLVENTTEAGTDTITVAADTDKDTVTVPASGKVKIGGEDGVEYTTAESNTQIEVTATCNKLTSGAVKLDKGEAVNLGTVPIENTSTGEDAITVSVGTPEGGNSVVVPAGGKVKIGDAEFDAVTDATIVIGDDKNELTGGSVTLNPDEEITVAGVSVKNTYSGEETKDITVSASTTNTVTVPEGGQANIGKAQITDVKQGTTFTISSNTNASVALTAGASVTINGVNYTTAVGEDEYETAGGTLTINPTTGNVTAATGVTVEVTEDSLKNSSFTYELIPGVSTIADKYTYTASSDGQLGDVTLKARTEETTVAGGTDSEAATTVIKALTPQITLKSANSTANVALKDKPETTTTYTAASANTVFAMAANDTNTKYIDLLDNNSSDANSALTFGDKDSHIVGGVTYQAQAVKDGATGADKAINYKITYDTAEIDTGKTDDYGNQIKETVNRNAVSVATDSKVIATMNASNTITIASGKVGDKTFTSALPFTATNSGASIVIDNTDNGNSNTITGNGRTYLSPVYETGADGEVNTDKIVGYTVTKKKSSSGTTASTNTTTNSDGSTTTTVIKSDGTKIETTTSKDGSITKIETKTETKTDGSSVTTEVKTETKADGTTTEVKSEAVTDKDGKTTKTETAKTTDASGSTGTKTTVTDSTGEATVKAEAEISTKAVEAAQKENTAVTVPVEVKATTDAKTAPTVEIKIDVKSSGSADTANTVKVEVPVTDANSGTVAVIVKEDGTEEIIKTSVPTENGVAISVSGNVTIKVVDNSKTFADTTNHWSKDEVNFVASRDLFNGVGGGNFGVNEPMTRGMVNTVLARLSGEDTTGGATWYDKGNDWAVKNGVSDGTNPTASVTREQLATMLYRYAGSPEVTGDISFADSSAISGYAQKALLWATQSGIINGMGDGTIAPSAEAERAQVAAMMARFIQSMN